MLDTSKVKLSQEYKNRMEQLHHDKIQINQEKIKELGFIDADDHGFIHFPDFKFEAIVHPEDNKVYGMQMLGDNYRKILNEMPVYINANSALATCWPGNLSNYMDIGWRKENEPVHLYKIHEEYDILQHGCGGMNHLCPDMAIGLELGWQGLLDKISYYRELNHAEEKEFYNGEEQLVLGMQEWIARHVKLAKSLADQESDQLLKNNYLEIAECNENLMKHPPKTLREACQFLAHFQCVDRMYCAGGAMGQLDELLRPFYEKDVKAGRITDEEAVWYIASLFFNDTHYAQLGGLNPSGEKDVTSRISFLILDATHYLAIPSNLGIRVHKDVNSELFKRSLEYNLEDGTGVCYSCNVGCEEGYTKNGYPMELARMRIKTGCNWTAIPGVEYPLQDVTRISMPKALEKAMDEMHQGGVYFTELLWNLFSKHLKIMVDCIKDGYDWHYEHISEDTPEIILNLFMHGPIERGLNCAEGGVDLINFNIDGIGLATVADSFGAIAQRIDEEKVLTFEQLYEALDHDYEGYEDIRLMMKNIKRFGAPHSPSDVWAKKIRDLFVELCRNEPTKKHHLPIIPGMFSHGDIVRYGNILKATPNGRKAGEPISHSNEPDPGFADGINSFSPSLKATAVADLQPGFGNSSPLHLDIDDSLISGEGGVDALMALIHTHNEMGGTLVNLNCLTKDRLLKAHVNPESDPDLVVRVTGYSAFFSSLSPKYRQQIVDRFLAS